ncbi:MAG: hypothetical protein KAI47_23770 [Deltaproteobacteria bacterium]|nr:hypothetical protein [Deltaproteobacteria bacterium]
MLLGGHRHGSSGHFFQGVAAVCVIAVVAAGCSATTTIVRRETKQATLTVETEPSGAEIYVNGKVQRQKTPAALSIPYERVHKRVVAGTKKTGWLLLITGILGAVGGGAATYLGFSGMGSSDGGDILFGTFAGTFGILAVVYGIIGLGGGAYLLATAPAPHDFYEATPSTLKLGVGLSGMGIREASISPDKKAHFGAMGIVRYRPAFDTWAAEQLGAGLKLTAKKSTAVDLSRLGGGLPRQGEARGGRSPSMASSRAILAVFDIGVRGAVLAPELVKRLSDYLSMRLASVQRFKIVPRDQLRKRLAKEKRKSYRQCIEQSCQIEIGKELAAQKTLSTVILRLGGMCKVSSVVYDLRSASSEGGASASGACSENGIVATLEKVVKKLAEAR